MVSYCRSGTIIHEDCGDQSYEFHCRCGATTPALCQLWVGLKIRHPEIWQKVDVLVDCGEMGDFPRSMYYTPIGFVQEMSYRSGDYYTDFWMPTERMIGWRASQVIIHRRWTSEIERMDWLKQAVAIAQFNLEKGSKKGWRARGKAGVPKVEMIYWDNSPIDARRSVDNFFQKLKRLVIA